MFLRLGMTRGRSVALKVPAVSYAPLLGARVGSRNVSVLGLGCMAAFSVALRLPFVSVPLNTDEGGYAYTAHWMMRGLVLYRDLWFDRPQATFLIYAAMERFLGESVEALRVGAALYNAATAVLLAALGRRVFGARAGLLAALIFAAASASPVAEGFTANGELLMNLPVVGALLLAVNGRWGPAGFVAALAVAIKPTAIASAAPALLVLATVPESASLHGGSSRLGIGLRRVGWIAAGGLVGLAPFVAHGIATDLAGYWYAVVGFRVEAHSVFSVGQAVLHDFLHTAPSVLAALLPLWLLTAAAFWRSSHLPRSAVLVGSAMLGGAVMGAAAGGYWYWHYYVGLLPGACLLGGAALARFSADGGPRVGRVGIGALAVATLVAVAFNARVVGPTPADTSFNLYRRPAYLASTEIADYLRRHTSPDDAIYAAFAQADLYHLAGRRCVGKQLYWTEINRVPGAFEDVLGALDDPGRRPRYVVEIQHELETPGRAEPFWARVEKLYRLETTIQGFRVFRLRGAGEAP